MPSGLVRAATVSRGVEGTSLTDTSPSVDSSAGAIDVCGVGSALVDILVEVTPAEIEACGLIKGSMQLMDLEASERVHARVPGGIERSGGSLANAIAGLASLGARVGFIGRVADDHFGSVFVADMAGLGVTFGRPRAHADADRPTGRCLVLVTPDADRTMCTTLGVAAHLEPSDIDDELVARSQVTFLEGYLWDEPVAKAAIRAAIAAAHGAGRKVAMTLSDPFCVERHRAEWRQLVADDIDIVLGNEAELCSLFEVDDLPEACRRVSRPGLVVTVTRGPDGAWALDGGGPIVEVAAAPVERVVDTTGAGDLYAAGFLFGLVRGCELATCARLGAVAAGEVISHVGARPVVDLAALVAGAGTDA